MKKPFRDIYTEDGHEKNWNAIFLKGSLSVYISKAKKKIKEVFTILISRFLYSINIYIKRKLYLSRQLRDSLS